MQNPWSWPAVFLEWSLLRKSSESKVIFLERTVAVICLHYSFWEKEVTNIASGIYSSGKQPILESTVTAVTPLFAKCRMFEEWHGWRGGINALFFDCKGGGSSEEEANMNPNQSQVLLMRTLLSKLLKPCVYDATWFARVPLWACMHRHFMQVA
jgi:hypothetical protein